MQKLLTKFDYLLFEAYRISEKDLGLYRILFCTASFLFYGLAELTWIGLNPDYFFFPPVLSLSNFSSHIPPVAFFHILKTGICLLYIMLLFGYHTKWVSLCLSAFLLTGYSYTYSFGKIDHNIMLVITPAIMAFSGWGNCYSIDETRQRKTDVNSWLVSFMAFAIGFAMFTASVPKIVRGWLSFKTHVAKLYMEHSTVFYDGIRTKPLLYDYIITIKSPLFWESIDYMTVIFEFGFLIAVLSPLVYRGFIVAALFFHIFVYLTFQISFTENLVVYALFINWGLFHSLINMEKVKRIINLKGMAIGFVIAILYSIYIHHETVKVRSPSIFKSFLGLFLSEDNAKLFEILLLFASAIIICFHSVIKYFGRQEEQNSLR